MRMDSDTGRRFGPSRSYRLETARQKRCHFSVAVGLDVVRQLTQHPYQRIAQRVSLGDSFCTSIERFSESGCIVVDRRPECRHGDRRVGIGRVQVQSGVDSVNTRREIGGRLSVETKQYTNQVCHTSSHLRDGTPAVRGLGTLPVRGEAGVDTSGCECKPDAKRKRDSAKPQERAQPSRERRLEKGDRTFSPGANAYCSLMLCASADVRTTSITSCRNLFRSGVGATSGMGAALS